MTLEVKKNLTQEQINSITEINNLILNRSFFNNNQDKILLNLNSLEINLNLRMLAFLSSLAFDKDIIIAKKSSFLIYRILTKLTYKEIKLLDNFFRSSYFYYDLDPKINTVDLGILKYKLSKNYYKDYILCLLTMNPNGYIREFAIQSLTLSNIENKLSFLILRLNDWVSEVRIAAELSLNNFLNDTSSIDMVLETLPLFNSLIECKRCDFKKIEFKLNTLIYDLKNRNLIISKYYKTKDYLVKRYLFKTLVKIPDIELKIIQAGIQSKDSIIIKSCLEKIEKDISNELLKYILPSLKKSKHANCVLMYCDYMEKNNPKQFKIELISKFIFHKSSKIRQHARSKISIIEPYINISNIYRSNFSDLTKFNIYAYQGFTEICSIHDFDFIKTFLINKDIRIIKSSLKCLSRLDFEKSKYYLLKFLCSESKLESKIARKIISSSESLIIISTEISELIFHEGFQEHVYENILYLLNYLPKWLKINTLLKFATLTPNNLFEYVIISIHGWISKYNKSFIEPSLFEKIQFVNSYEKIENKLDINLKKDLSALVKYFKNDMDYILKI